jgi:hypothetical protein
MRCAAADTGFIQWPAHRSIRPPGSSLKAQSRKSIDYAINLSDARFERVDEIARRNITLPQARNDIAGRLPDQFRTHDLAVDCGHSLPSSAAANRVDR